MPSPPSSSPSSQQPASRLAFDQKARARLHSYLSAQGLPSLTRLSAALGGDVACALTHLLEFAEKTQQAAAQGNSGGGRFLAKQAPACAKVALGVIDIPEGHRDCTIAAITASATVWAESIRRKFKEVREIGAVPPDGERPLERRRLAYLLEVAKYKSSEVFASAPGEKLDLISLASRPPAATSLRSSSAAWLVVGFEPRASSSGSDVRIVVARALLRRTPAGAGLGSWAPAPEDGVILNRDAFFDEEDEPRGSWSHEDFFQASDINFPGARADAESDADPEVEVPDDAQDVDDGETVELEQQPETTMPAWSDLWNDLCSRLCFLVRVDSVQDLSLGVQLPRAGKLTCAWLIDADEVKLSVFPAALERMLGEAEISTAAAQGLAAQHAAADLPSRAAEVISLAQQQSKTGLETVFGPALGEITGHMDSFAPDGGDGQPAREAFALDSTQRLAARASLGLQGAPGQAVHAVTGPPGSGKTAFLRAVLASHWVNAALVKAEHPPTVFATAATNKAVTNIIDAFASCVDGRSDLLESRWLSGAPTYGFFLAAANSAKEYSHHMLLNMRLHLLGAAESFLQTPAEEHQRHYLAAAARALHLPSKPGEVKPTLELVLQRLHERLSTLMAQRDKERAQFARNLAALRTGWSDVHRSSGTIRRQTRDLEGMLARQADLGDVAGELSRMVAAAKRLLDEHRDLDTGFVSALRRIFTPGAYRRRRGELDEAKNRLSTRSMSPGLGVAAWPDLWLNAPEVLSAWETRAVQLARELRELRATVDADGPALKQRAEARKTWLASARQVCGRSKIGTWRHLISALNASGPGARAAEQLLAERLEAQLDLQVRVPAFHLAARYWEGRWLQDQLADNGKPSDRLTLEQVSMLSVVTVATTHMLAIFMGNQVDLPVVDLLVIDEAGQCEPDVGMAVFGSAKTALLVGDLAQLKPVKDLPAHASRALALRAGLDCDADALQLPRGMDGRGGSAMALAAHGASWNSLGPKGWSAGIMLGYHYRCHPVIAQYCNALMYGGSMRMVRANMAMPMPPMAWVEVNGTPTPQGRSWTNDEEARAIAQWLKREHVSLSQRYKGKPLDEIVGVVTPLKAQANHLRMVLELELAPALGLEGSEIVKRMMTNSGTVHRLQGAERPVIAFTLVQNTPGALFADRDGGNLMNVAVSRAKDCFVMFASPAILRPEPAAPASATSGTGAQRRIPARAGRSPVAMLARYMLSDGQRLYPRHLVIIEAAGKTRQVQKTLGSNVAVLATNGSFEQSALTPDGLKWLPMAAAATDRGPPGMDGVEKLLSGMRPHHGHLDSVVIATDDDMAGELIGMRAAEHARVAMTDIPITRMRMHSLEPDEIQLSWDARGADFDGDLLSAALLREVMRHWDEHAFARALPGERYVSLPQRAALRILDHATTSHDDPLVEVHFKTEPLIETGSTQDSAEPLDAFVASSRAATAQPVRIPTSQAKALIAAISAALTPGPAKNSRELGAPTELQLQQLPGLYPPTTTMRVLGLAATELDLWPEEASRLLSDLYLEAADE